MARELYTDITLGEDVYRIKKMTAMDGSGLAMFAVSKAIPLLMAAQSVFNFAADEPEKPGKKTRGKTPQAGEESAESDDILKAIDLIPAILSSISDEERKSILTTCLNNVEKILPAGPHPVMTGKVFTIPELEYDTTTCMVLAIQSIVYNCKGFFDGNGLTSLKPMIGAIFQPKQ